MGLSVLLPRRDWWRFVLLGGVVYGNQACFVTGIKLAGPVAGAIWQPSQPLITAALSMLLGYEPVNPRRIVAIVLSLSGCVFMVIVAAASSSSSAAAAVSTNKVSVSIDTAAGIVQSSNNHNNQYSTNDDKQQQQQQQRIWMGNVLFFINCLCTSVFILLSRTKAFQRYPPLFITATTYAIAAIIMIPTAILVSVSESLSNFFCPECPFDFDPIAIATASSSSAAVAAASSNYWSIPPSAMGALFYNVIFTSVIAYGILMWANKKSKTGTMVMAYTVLQPVTASILTVLLVHVFHLVPDCATNTKNTSHRKIITAAATEEDVTACLTPPGWDAVIGTIAVLIGLLLVIDTEPKSNASSSSSSGSENKALHPAPAGGIVLLETKTKEIMDTTDNTLHNRSKSNTEFDLLLPRSLTESSF